MVTQDKRPRRTRGPGRAYVQHRELVIGQFHAERLSADAIMDRLASADELAGVVPDRRTVVRWMREAIGPGPEWTLAGEADPDAAAIVLRVLAGITWASRRAATITTDEATWTVRIARSAPGLEAIWAYRVGLLYRDRVARERPTRDLDVYLGSAPWADATRYLSIIENGAVDEWFAEGWHPPLALVVGRQYDGGAAG